MTTTDTITVPRATVQQALETMQLLQNTIYNIGGEHVTGWNEANDAADSAEKPMEDLRAALAEPQEPDDARYALAMLIDPEKLEPWQLELYDKTMVALAEPRSGIKQVIELYDSPEPDHKDLLIAQLEETNLWQAKRIAELMAEPQEPVALRLKRNNDMWNPLTDDGDALRLAVKLNLLVHSGQVYSGVDGFAPEKNNGDPYAATRRAIVRAAAEIGRNMK